MSIFDDLIIESIQAKLGEAGINVFVRGFVIVAAVAHADEDPTDASDDKPAMITMSGQSPFVTVGLLTAAAECTGFREG